MRVLIVCGDNWPVWENGAEVTTVAKLNEGGNATTDTALTAKYADTASKSIASSV